MKLWMSGYNKETGGVPAELVKDVDGLVQVMSYIETMRYNL